MIHYTEKRQHIRVPLTFVTVEVFAGNNYDEVDSSETYSIVDISETGMKFISKERYEINQPLQLTFILPGSTIIIRASSVVIYQQPHNSLYYTGVQYTDLGLVEFTLLKKYIEVLTKKN